MAICVRLNQRTQDVTYYRWYCENNNEEWVPRTMYDTSVQQNDCNITCDLLQCYNTGLQQHFHVQSVTGWSTCRSAEKVCNRLKCMLGSLTKTLRSKLPSNRSNIPLVTIGGGIYSNMFKTSAYAVALKQDLMSQC